MLILSLGDQVKTDLSMLIASALSVSAIYALRHVKLMRYTKYRVLNSGDSEIFNAYELPGFRHQGTDCASVQRFRESILHLSYPNEPSLDSAIRSMKWVRELQGDDKWQPPYRDVDDPNELLAQILGGQSGACRRCAFLLTGALVALGFRARLISCAAGFFESDDSHCMTEVWITELGKWVLLDPTHDVLFRIEGQLAGLYEVFSALRNGGALILEQGQAAQRSPVSVDYYRVVLKHIFVARTNEFFQDHHDRLWGFRRTSYLHFFDETVPAYPQKRKSTLFALAITMIIFSAVALLSVEVNC